jgi:hypothetical protein
VAADGGGNGLEEQSQDIEKTNQEFRRRLEMKSNAKKTTKKWKQVVVGAVALVALVLVVLRLETKKSARAGDGQITFQSSAEAGTALVNAAKSGDEDKLERILGVDTKAILSAGDRDSDMAAMQAFASKYEKMNRWVDMSDGSRMLYVGADNFSFPVPLAKDSAGQWHFDGVAGAEEVRARNIGRNELMAIDACAAVAAAQEVYFIDNGSQYAQRIISSEGKQDGLYWPASEQRGPSPLSRLNDLPKSSLTSLSPRETLVIDGYAFRMLMAQGDDAPTGPKDYVVNGRMTGGFALLATPVKYGETGVMTFMTNQDGTVYETDFGPDTAKIVASIQEFNPTDDWSPVE